MVTWTLFGRQDQVAEIQDDEPIDSRPTEGANDTNPAQPTELLPVALYKKVSPAVVSIYTETWDDTFKSGSGFLVSNDGLVTTNFHVIRRSFRTQISFEDGSSHEVEGVTAVDEANDLAILKISGRSFPHLELADGDLPDIGSKVFAIGSPKGFTNTFSDGLVSGRRKITETGGDITMIQTTAPISRGSSGGPLLATDGKVVGVTTLSWRDSQNLNLAVSVKHLIKLLKERGPVRSLTDEGFAHAPPSKDIYRPVAATPSIPAPPSVAVPRPVVVNQPAGWTDDDKETLAHFFRAHKLGQDASAVLRARLAPGQSFLTRKEWIALSNRYVAALDEAKLAARGNLGRFHPLMPVAFRMNYIWYLDLTKRNIEQEGKFGAVEQLFWLQRWQEWLTANRNDIRFPDEVPVRHREGLTDAWARKCDIFEGLNLPKFVAK
jgi:hypothetical protein